MVPDAPLLIEDGWLGWKLWRRHFNMRNYNVQPERGTRRYLSPIVPCGFAVGDPTIAGLLCLLPKIGELLYGLRN